MDYTKKAKKIIQNYIDKEVIANLDGLIFDDEPSEFKFQFSDPDELREAITELYCDEMDMEPWNEAIPVAAVSVPDRSPDEFAWIFLHWADDESDPEILVATADNWSGSLSASSLDEFKLEII